jgi:branched-chain amino acid transport system permease protein
MGTIFGPVVGAFVVVTLQNYLAQFGGWVTVITGAIFVACVLLFRRGIVGELAHLFRPSRAEPTAPAQPQRLIRPARRPAERSPG